MDIPTTILRLLFVRFIFSYEQPGFFISSKFSQYNSVNGSSSFCRDIAMILFSILQMGSGSYSDVPEYPDLIVRAEGIHSIKAFPYQFRVYPIQSKFLDNQIVFRITTLCQQ